MKNIYLDDGTRADIDRRINRVLADLGNPEAKIELPSVRELLRLDLQYYTLNDPNLVNEVVHKMRMGAKQLLERPSLLFDAIRNFDLKALVIPDAKRILIDSSLAELKKRWSETHEICHTLLPWHAEYMLGDNKHTLSVGCHDQIEAEANYAAGQLLFPRKTFSEMVSSAPPSINHVKAISTRFGNTITTTLWRVIEHSDDVIFGLVGEHPRHPKEGEPMVAYFIRSRSFEKQFGNVSDELLFDHIKNYCSYRKAGPLGSSEVQLIDDNGERFNFEMESFGNSHKVLTLGRYTGKAPVVIMYPLQPESVPI